MPNSPRKFSPQCTTIAKLRLYSEYPISHLKKPLPDRGQAEAAVPPVFPPAPPPAFRARPLKRRPTRFLHPSAEKIGKAPYPKPVEKFSEAPSIFSR